MYVSRQQPWQIGYTDFEMQILLKLFRGEDLDHSEDSRADHMLRTLQTQYDRLRIKTGDDRNNHRDDGNNHSREQSTHKSPYMAETEQEQEKEVYKVPAEAESASVAPAKPRGAGRKASRIGAGKSR